MKRAHSSGKLKGTKKPITRKKFVALLESLGGDTLVSDFYEAIEPLDKEVAELRTMHSVVCKASVEHQKKLAEMIEQNEMLYDRLMLSLDGERPPKGILFTVEALAPFAAAAETFAGRDDGEVAVGFSDDRLLTVKDLRDAANSYEHFIGKKR